MGKVKIKVLAKRCGKLSNNLIRGGGNPMENPKVKTKVRDPPNLIPGIDIRCFALKTTYFRPKKNGALAILLFGFFGIYGQLEATGRKGTSLLK